MIVVVDVTQIFRTLTPQEHDAIHSYYMVHFCIYAGYLVSIILTHLSSITHLIWKLESFINLPQ